jgi:hypothetical protein
MPHFPVRRHRLHLDPTTAERLVDGQVEPDDAPPGYGPVVRLLREAARPPQAVDIEGEERALAMFAAEREEPTSDLLTGTKPHPLTRSRKAAAALVAGALVLTGGVAAAATGHLPDPAQSVAHTSFDHIGISIPDARGKATPDNKGQKIKTTTQDPANSGSDHGPIVCADASNGQCQAGEHGQPDPALPPDSGTPGDSGDPVTPGRPVDPGASGNHAPPASTPPASTPVGPPSSLPTGPPSSVPVGPPTSAPGSHASRIPSVPVSPNATH